MLRSLRSRLIVASVLWTGGLLMLMHMLSLVMIHVLPGSRGWHGGIPVIAGIVAMIAGFAVARRGLTPFQELRRRLIAIREGSGQRVEGAYPVEIVPLVQDLNGLLANREETIRRAQATAGDLAHGLKTPLALIVQEVDRLRAAGQSESADLLAQQVERMSRQVDYHLARARAASAGSSGAARTELEPVIGGLVRTIHKLHAAKNLQIDVRVPADTTVRMQREDLEEVLGNLLDNAAKWASARVVVEAVGGQVTVDDDGPGIAPALRQAVLERGVRADEAAPGSGLGLSIVRDLVELYGGAVMLEDSPLGGLRVRLTLPR